jgi:hypothetical protein
MYDYFLGSKDDIARDEPKYLLAVKRMLPKWLNGIPDAEYLLLFSLLEARALAAAAAGRRAVFVETGVGASTLPMMYVAMKHPDVLALSWDPNAEKASQIRSVALETFGTWFTRHVDPAWRHVPYVSVSDTAGLAVLSELVDGVDYFLHDSDHVWNTIRAELDAVQPLLNDDAIVAIDDAQYGYLHTSEYIVTVIRRKLGLGPPAFADNTCRPFYLEAEAYLHESWHEVTEVAGDFRAGIATDLTYPYYSVDQEVRRGVDAEVFRSQEHRFAAWQVRRRR